MRGALTPQVQQISKKMIGREITLVELRLIPYCHYVMTNEQKLNPRKINKEERGVLRSWKKSGFIEGGASGLAITKDFWDFMCEILWEAYVVQPSDNPSDWIREEKT